jgi:hypothetical protein
VNLDVIVLGFANAVRPTALAVTYALLSAARPWRLLAAFVGAGLIFSLAIGILVVAVMNGAEVRSGTTSFDAVVELLAGVAAIGFSAGLFAGRAMPGRRTDSDPSWVSRRLRDPSLKVAAAAGVTTHLPGLFYLVALNAISAEDPSLLWGVIQVGVFNALWWSLPIASLVLSLLRPERTRESLGQVNAWVRRNQQAILAAVFAVVGLYLTAKGAVDLID